MTIDQLREHILEHIEEHSEGTAYCTECEYYLCDNDEFGDIEKREHAEDCPVTQLRIEAGLESPMFRKLRRMEERLAALEEWTHIDE